MFGTGGKCQVLGFTSRGKSGVVDEGAGVSAAVSGQALGNGLDFVETYKNIQIRLVILGGWDAEVLFQVGREAVGVESGAKIRVPDLAAEEEGLVKRLAKIGKIIGGGAEEFFRFGL
ncbi:MAG: hypothetical protein G01um101416_1153 [Microgenomates group bacterium Gr01-1014_16]|nr:MAG: hypothetical protein G01um101416_1153 [Microgenomates group bacterium Gr01-1014_16]